MKKWKTQKINIWRLQKSFFEPFQKSIIEGVNRSNIEFCTSIIDFWIASKIDFLIFWIFHFWKKNCVKHFIFHFSCLKMGDPIFHFSFLAGWLAVSLAGWLFGWIRWMVDWPLANNICWFQVVLVNPYAWTNNNIFIFPFEAEENHKAFFLFICSS